MRSTIRAPAGHLASLAVGATLFAGNAEQKLTRLQAELAPLAARYDVVVANPTYMGGKNMDRWLGAWIKKQYPNVKGDLCTCFIERVLLQLEAGGYTGLATSNSWMFLSSYEKLRKEIIENHNIATLVQLSVHGFKGIAAQVCTFVLTKGKNEGMRGGYVRLNDFDHHSLQEEKTLEALADPRCGWFYRREATDFKAIPGSPIAYWASRSMVTAFSSNPSLASISAPKQGLVTGDNDTFLRLWWEVQVENTLLDCLSRDESKNSGAKWFPCNKGGGYRRWYGLNEYLIDWENDGYRLRHFVDDKGRLRSRPQNIDFCFKPGCTWGTITSASLSMRYSPRGFISEHAGSMIYSTDNSELNDFILGFTNSSTAEFALRILSPTLRFTEGPVGLLPIMKNISVRSLAMIVNNCIEISRQDWNALECSWDFKKHPLT